MAHRKPILITGAGGGTAGVGRRVVELLRERGVPVRAMVHREDERVQALRDNGAQVVVGDLARPSDVAAALVGCERMFFVMSVSPVYLEAAVTVATVAREAGALKALVSLSQMTVSQMTAVSSVESKQQRLQWQAEQVLRWSGLPVVQIRPTVLLENPLFTTLIARSLAEEGVIRLPFGGGRTSPVAAEDVASSVAAVLQDPDPHIGQVYELTGPRSQDMTGVAEEYSRALGRRVTYVDVPFDAWAGQIPWGDGISPHLQAHLKTMALLHRDNYYDRATATVESLTGHLAQTVESFVAGHAGMFHGRSSKWRFGSHARPPLRIVKSNIGARVAEGRRRGHGLAAAARTQLSANLNENMPMSPTREHASSSTARRREQAATFEPGTGTARRRRLHLVHDHHPGADDPAYRARRDEIAAAALLWRPGQPAPRIEYTEAEQHVWQTVCRELAPRYERYAIAEFREGVERLGLSRDHVPNLDDVSARLSALTGFRFAPAAGRVELRAFYGSLRDRVFRSTQYVRHSDAPFYTSEPDVIHEVIGHGHLLATPTFSELHRLAGEATHRLRDGDNLEFLSKVFWFSLECGVVIEDGSPRAYGAGILSSYGEIEEFRGMEHRPLDLVAMGSTAYDITAYQPILYRADSLDEVREVVGGFFATCTDESVAELRATARALRRGARPDCLSGQQRRFGSNRTRTQQGNST